MKLCVQQKIMEKMSNNLFKNISRVKIIQLDSLIIWFLLSAHFFILKKPAIIVEYLRELEN